MVAPEGPEEKVAGAGEEALGASEPPTDRVGETA